MEGSGEIVKKNSRGRPPRVVIHFGFWAEK